MNLQSSLQTIAADLKAAAAFVESHVDVTALESVAGTALLTGGPAAVLPAVEAHLGSILVAKGLDPKLVSAVVAVLAPYLHGAGA